MSTNLEDLVAQIHCSAGRVVLSLSGGGSRAISALTEVPGASRTLLDAVVPYSRTALVEWLGGYPDQYCSAETARRMAMVGFLRALKLEESDVPLAGVGCAGSLITDRPKKGPHRAHVAIQTVSFTAVRSIWLVKEQRNRAEEEDLVSRLVLNAVAEACGLEPVLDLDLVDDERFERSQTIAPPAWQELLLGRREIVPSGPPAKEDEPEGHVIFAGAFHPLHAGHRRMVQIAEELLGRPVEFELTILNPDKPPIDYSEIKRRLDQFDSNRRIWLTRAPTFVEKARLLPGTTFVVGTDTLRRIADPRYYGNDPAACRAALLKIAARGCRFLVFGRNMGLGYIGLQQLDLPDPLRSMCQAVGEDVFREDVSSTEIRRALLEDENL
ncbi:MAG TPA: CinA family protein [Thermoguttaceae bacterium]|nr:CinA family protein [Thermoguttaceae bacterium]